LAGLASSSTRACSTTLAARGLSLARANIWGTMPRMVGLAWTGAWASSWRSSSGVSPMRFRAIRICST